MEIFCSNFCGTMLGCESLKEKFENGTDGGMSGGTFFQISIPEIAKSSFTAVGNAMGM